LTAPGPQEATAAPGLQSSAETGSFKGRASIFITCLVDFLFPQVGEAMVRVLRRLGVEVDFPAAQTCCGQPAFNAGFRREAREVALHFLRVFEASEVVVSPSGSCVAMVREFYPELFHDDPEMARRFRELGHRTFEFSQFLTERLGVTAFPGRCGRSVTWHDCCHSLRGLGIREGPRRLIKSLEGIDFRELPDAEVCCGFGGLFSVKFPSISCAMLDDKLACVERTGAERLVASDASCLMHLGGGLKRRGSKVQAQHLAELLAEAME
jgi:L-lactate dehydrogenase complex protein LldE